MQVSVNLHHLQQQEYSLDKELREVRALRSALEQWELAAGYSPKIRQLLRAAEQEEEEYITDRRRMLLRIQQEISSTMRNTGDGLSDALGTLLAQG